jgi:hypothetical protein
MNTGSAKTCLDTGWMSLERRLRKLGNDVNTLVSAKGVGDITFDGISSELDYLARLSGSFGIQLVHFNTRLESIKREFNLP